MDLTKLNAGRIQQLDGKCDARFAQLAETFVENFSLRGDTGAAVAVYLRGKKVVDLYASNQSPNGLWQASDRICTMSSCKAPLAFCLLLLIERDQLHLDASISSYWPEFVANGKSSVTVKHLLTHTAGLAIIRNCQSGDLFNWQKMTQAIAAAKPMHPPGEALYYHALTFGHIAGELIRRIDGRMPSEFFHQEISVPHDIAYDLSHLPGQYVRKTPAIAQFNKFALWFYSQLPRFVPYWKMQFFRPCNSDYQPNSEAWRSSEFPAVSGQGSARGLANFYAFLATKGVLDGEQLCSQKSVAELSYPHVSACEQATQQHWRMGLGFMLNSPEFISFGPGENTFGHAGMGGSIGFADPDEQLSFAFVTEHYHQLTRHDKSMEGQRLRLLIDNCYSCLGSIKGDQHE